MAGHVPVTLSRVLIAAGAYLMFVGFALAFVAGGTRGD